MSVWEWDVEASFNPHFDAKASADGVAYACEIQGPFCGYDQYGKQSWDEFLIAGPPERVKMPPSITAEIRAWALAHVAKKWSLHGDQWSQTSYEYREGKLYFCENDNKEQQYSEREVDIDGFLREHASTPTTPHPEMVAFLTGARRGG